MFRRCIRNSTEILCIRALVGIEPASNTKVDQLHITTGCDHNIAGFEITQNNGRVKRMDIAEGLTHLHHPLNHILFVKRSLVFFEHLIQALPRHKLHDKVIIPTLLEAEQKRGDMWMLKTEQQVNLFIKTLNGGPTFLRTGVKVY